MLCATTGCDPEIRQPIAFSHDLHVRELEVECDVCHDGSKSGEVAGLPAIAVCSDCHGDPKGGSAEEQKIVDAVHAGTEVQWTRLYELPRHVYFSHRRHTGAAGLVCSSCHGAIASQKTPPPGPLLRLTMDVCLDCHRERAANTDCVACHR